MKRLPGDLPAWLTTARMLTCAHAVGLASCLLPWTAMMTGQRLEPTSDVVAQYGALAIGVPATLTLTTATALLVARARTAATAALASAIGSALAFTVVRCAVVFHLFANTPRRNGAVTFVDGEARLESSLGPEMIPQLVIACVVGMIVGGLVGLALARPAMWVTGEARTSRAAGSGDALLGVGVWLLVPAAVSAFLAAIAYVVHNEEVSSLLVASLAAPFASTLAVLFGLLLLLRRARWVAAVRRGEVPGYRIRVASPNDAALPGLEAVERQTDGVLEAVVGADHPAPYRAGSLAEPIARIDLGS